VAEHRADVFSFVPRRRALKLTEDAARWIASRSPAKVTAVSDAVVWPLVMGAKPESPIEELLLWAMVARRSELPRFTLQHRIQDENGRIITRADAAFVDERLAIFCDGARYHLNDRQQRRDQRQRSKLCRLGWAVLAFYGHEIHRDADECVSQVAETIRVRRERERE
jgi:very-short-patch-repair endonuclease